MSRELAWDDLRIFLAAYRAESLRKASQNLGVGLSTVSRRVAALEQTAGVPLFARTAEGLRPTAAAHAIAADAERAESLTLSIAKTLEAMSDEVEGLVKVATTSDVASTVLVPFLDDLLDAHPQLTVELFTGSEVRDLERFEVDLAIRTRRPDEGENLVCARLRGTALGLYGSRSYVARHGAERPLREHTWIASGSHQGHYATEAIRNAVAPGARIALRVNELRTAKDAVLAGLGVGLLPRTMAEVVPGLVAIESKELPRMNGGLWLVAHAATRKVPRVAAVWAFLKDIFDEARNDDNVAALRARNRARYGAGED